MKKLWPYIATLLLGAIGGLVMMWYMVRNKISSVTLGKIKQKGGPGNTMNTEAVFEAVKGIDKKLTRAQRRAARKERRLARVK